MVKNANIWKQGEGSLDGETQKAKQERLQQRAPRNGPKLALEGYQVVRLTGWVGSEGGEPENVIRKWIEDPHQLYKGNTMMKNVEQLL